MLHSSSPGGAADGPVRHRAPQSGQSDGFVIMVPAVPRLTIPPSSLRRQNQIPYVAKIRSLRPPAADTGRATDRPRSLWLNRSRLAEKLAVTNAQEARQAAFRFVAGELDPMSTRELFLATARQVIDPILAVYGAATPRRSKAEMEALGNLPNVQSCELPVGKLAVHEEFPVLVAEAVHSLFCARNG